MRIQTVLLLRIALFLGLFLYSIPVSRGLIRYDGDGTLSLFNTHLNESATILYRKENGRYSREALSELSHLLRCRLTGEAHEIPVELVELVDTIQDHFGGKEIQVISAYRSPTLNESLVNAGRKVAKNSLHMQGMAMDIRIPEVSTSDLRNYALSLKRGGVGFYPGNGFVHVDIGRVRQW